MNNSIAIVTLFKELEETVALQSTGSIKLDGVYLCAVRAAFAKNYELNCFIAEAKEISTSFALTSSLRGLCEDIIALKYYASFEKDRDEIVHLLMMEDTFRLMDKQRIFFAANRPHQPILSTQDMTSEIHKINADLKTLDPKTPSIEQMAKATGLLPMYEFLYVATCSYVHFSPRNLLRSGWGSDIDNMKFSTINFAGYYDAFNRFYGVFLFVTFCTTFANLLNAQGVLKPCVDKLIQILEDEDRWPELVTPEEMNKPKLSDLYYILGLAAHRKTVDVSIWKWEKL